MSSAKPPEGKEPVSLQSTRQMLDELDALMDRMLAIPVNDLEDAIPPPYDIVHAPTVSATLTMMERPLEEQEAEVEPPRYLFPSYTTDLNPALQEATSEALEPNTPAPDPINDEVIPPPLMVLQGVITSPAPPTETFDLPGRSLAGYCLLPLLWVNQCFDKGTTLLSWRGAWLRGPRGRHFLGASGLALLAVAGLWLVKDWLGWTW